LRSPYKGDNANILSTKVVEKGFVCCVVLSFAYHFVCGDATNRQKPGRQSRMDWYGFLGFPNT